MYGLIFILVIHHLSFDTLTLTYSVKCSLMDVNVMIYDLNVSLTLRCHFSQYVSVLHGGMTGLSTQLDEHHHLSVLGIY